MLRAKRSHALMRVVERRVGDPTGARNILHSASLYAMADSAPVGPPSPAPPAFTLDDAGERAAAGVRAESLERRASGRLEALVAARAIAGARRLMIDGRIVVE